MKTTTPMIPHDICLLFLFRLRGTSWQKWHFITKQTGIFCRLHSENLFVTWVRVNLLQQHLEDFHRRFLRFFCLIHTNNVKTITATGDSDANYWMNDSSNCPSSLFLDIAIFLLVSLSVLSFPPSDRERPYIPPLPFFLRLHGNSLEVTVLLTQAESDHTSH